ncbi:MAG: hypothetical protein ACP5UA_13895, partial [Candidatus Hydrogenedens sp.]
VPIFINQKKTYEIIKIIENRMEELTKYYQVTRTQTFALRIAYESLLELEKEKIKIKERENEIENKYKNAIKNLEKIIQKIKNRFEEG